MRQETDEGETNNPFEELTSALKPWIVAIAATNERLREVFQSEQARQVLAALDGFLKRPETSAALQRLAEMQARFKDRAVGPITIPESFSVRSSVNLDPFDAYDDPPAERPRRKIGFDRGD